MRGANSARVVTMEATARVTSFHLYGEMYPVILFIVDHLRIHAGHTPSFSGRSREHLSHLTRSRWPLINRAWCFRSYSTPWATSENLAASVLVKATERVGSSWRSISRRPPPTSASVWACTTSAMAVSITAQPAGC